MNGETLDLIGIVGFTAWQSICEIRPRMCPDIDRFDAEK